MEFLQADRNRLYRDVEFLTSIYPYRNYKNLESLRKAARYIESEFQKAGLSTDTQQWQAKGNTYENIIASFQPHKKQRFIVGAHYDVYKDQPGADDNASSVAGLLELGRLLSQHRPPLAYGIDLVSFCLEEPPFFKKKTMGSYVHAQSVYERKQEVIGMAALEMIGYYDEQKNHHPENPDRAADNKKLLVVSGIKKFDAFNKKLSRLLKTPPGIIDSRRLSYADDYLNNGPSDHRNYWPYNYPAAMIIGTGKTGNPHYHKPTDTIETLDFKMMTEATNRIAYAVSHFQDDSP